MQFQGTVNGKSVRTDTKGRVFVQIQDDNTGQYMTVYPKLNSAGKPRKPLLKSIGNLSEGDIVVFSGTVHPISKDNVKLIATGIETLDS